MGILGRPRRRKDGAGDNAQTAAHDRDGAALLRRQMTGSDPVLARVAEEALLAEAASRGKTTSGPQDPRICAGFNASICALPPAQVPPQGPISASQRDRYGRELAASIRARTAPVLLSKDEVLAALDVKRVPGSTCPPRRPRGASCISATMCGPSYWAGRLRRPIARRGAVTAGGCRISAGQP